MADDIVVCKPEPLELLNARERSAYRNSIEKKEPFLAASFSDQLYQLYQSGRTCEEIRALNPGLSLGTVIRARIDGHWDERRNTYLESLACKARQTAQQLSLESLGFLGDLLTAFHSHDRARLQRFIQTGDPSELNGALMSSPGQFKLYRDVLEMVLKVTGQDQNKKVSGVVEHIHTVEQPKTPRPLTPEEAAKLLAAIPEE